MATLKDLFEQKSQNIYKKFAPSDNQLVVVKPDTDGVFGSRSRVKNDSQSIPTVSVLRDTRRVSKFLTSSEGVLFLAKQTLLQTGNTFVTTKLYNPLSPVLNTVPFLHIRRFIPAQIQNIHPSGLLQNTTVENIASRIQIVGAAQAIQSITRKTLLPTVKSLASTYLGSQLKGAVKSVIPLPQNYYGSRPEYTKFGYINGTLVISPTSQGPMILDRQPLDQRGSQRLSYTATIKSQLLGKAAALAANAINKLVPPSLSKVVSIPQPYVPTSIPTFIQAAEEFRNKQKFRKGQRALTSQYFTEGGPKNDNGVASPLTSETNSINAIKPILTKKTKDPYNQQKLVSTTERNILNYNNIIKEQKRNSDIIKFVFTDVTENNPVHFRALISNIKESIKTEFNEQRYIGRTERFVTYGGAKRGLNLTFNIVAFSPDEADGMWSRVNYLSGLAFPKGVQNGFMIPPLFKLTIGALYENQPCYIEALDYDFLDETITFDTNKEVPFAINVNMQLSILEKRSRFHNSPFYKITEDIADVQTITVDDAAARRLETSLSAVSIPDNLVPAAAGTPLLDDAINRATQNPWRQTPREI